MTPPKPMLGADGTAMRDDRGRIRYSKPLIEFTSRAARDRFTTAVQRCTWQSSSCSPRRLWDERRG
jgi:hypothetical protein